MMPPWAMKGVAWVVLGVVYGVLMLYRRPQLQGAGCFFMMAAVFAWPVLILVDLLVWATSRTLR